MTALLGDPQRMVKGRDGLAASARLAHQRASVRSFEAAAHDEIDARPARRTRHTRTLTTTGLIDREGRVWLVERMWLTGEEARAAVKRGADWAVGWCCGGHCGSIEWFDQAWYWRDQRRERRVPRKGETGVLPGQAGGGGGI